MVVLMVTLAHQNMFNCRRASSVMRLGSHGGSHTTSTSQPATPGTASTASRTWSGSSCALGQPGAVEGHFHLHRVVVVHVDRIHEAEFVDIHRDFRIVHAGTRGNQRVLARFGRALLPAGSRCPLYAARPCAFTHCSPALHCSAPRSAHATAAWRILSATDIRARSPAARNGWPLPIAIGAIPAARHCAERLE